MDSTAYYKSFAHTSGIIQMLSNHFNIHTLYTANKAFGEYVSDVVRVNDRSDNIELFKIYLRQHFKHIGTATTLLNFKDILGDK